MRERRREGSWGIYEEDDCAPAQQKRCYPIGNCIRSPFSSAKPPVCGQVARAGNPTPLSFPPWQGGIQGGVPCGTSVIIPGSSAFVASSDREADISIEKAFSAIERFGDRINFFSEKSELSAINRNAGIAPVKVSPETLDVIEKAVYVARISGGAFDPTIGPEIRLWDFSKKIKPTDEEIKKDLPLVDFRKIAVDRKKSTVFLSGKDMLMDLGGIAKGYAADLAVEALKNNGISAGIVAVAGDIRTFGRKPDGNSWNVGIRNPRQKTPADELMAKARLRDNAISTSGDYERYFISEGKRFHHILDPSTGYPAGLCRSVTVITDKGVFTDTFSTAVFVLGPEKGMELMRKTGMDAIIIDRDGGVHTTPGIKNMVTFENRH
jgi:thiamine biosynthesis lipoprotein